MNLQQVTYEASYGTFEQLPPSTVPEYVFSGRSNVGKSSLLNAVLGRRSLARVSSKPGKTITINFFRGDSARLVDLPGYGYAKRPKAEQERWSRMIQGYFTSDREIALVLQLIDMRHAASRDDHQMLAFLQEMNLPFVVVLTKSDKLNKTEYKQALAARTDECAPYGPSAVIPFSSTKKTGVEEIRRFLLSEN